MTVASACCTTDVSTAGSSVATTCPRFTVWLKSAPSEAMVPLTWVPTSTVSTGASVPVAETDTTIGSRVTAAVLSRGGASPASARR
jgi:hypothetical protein